MGRSRQSRGITSQAGTASGEVFGPISARMFGLAGLLGSMVLTGPVFAFEPATRAPRAATPMRAAEAAPTEEPMPEIDPERLKDKKFVLGHELKRIDGKPEKLAKYDGKVLLIVNVASNCGYTPQYAGLEKLYRTYKDRGLVVLGIPANDFGGQEPGSNKQILEFCTGRFDVTFPMFEKVEVTGEDKDPLYKQLAELPEPLGGEPKWNFTKFLVDREGIVVDRFESRVAPSDQDLIEHVEELLGPEETSE